MAQTVLVTGASGFIAAHVVEAFLQKGYNVRGTVRSDKTAAKVLKTHAKYSEQISVAIVPDIAAPNAFDEAVKGVDGVSRLLVFTSSYLKSDCANIPFQCLDHPHSLSLHSECRRLRDRAFAARHQRHNIYPRGYPEIQLGGLQSCRYLLFRLSLGPNARPAPRIRLHRGRLEPRDCRSGQQQPCDGIPRLKDIC